MVNSENINDNKSQFREISQTNTMENQLLTVFDNTRDFFIRRRRGESWEK